MIPKIIHYCWFGGKPLPPLAERCIASWKKWLPDYEIHRWDESNFDVNSIEYTRQAYARKKYAFVSDYARFWILYNYGGIYFDVDVEVVAPFNDIIERGPFLGVESDSTTVKGIVSGADLPLHCNPGLAMGAEKGMSFYATMLKRYANFQFLYTSGAINTTTVVSYTSQALLDSGFNPTLNIESHDHQFQLIEGITIYPKRYFCPTIKDGNIYLLPDTRSIHHYAASWVTPFMRFKGKLSAILYNCLPSSVFKSIRKFYRKILQKK